VPVTPLFEVTDGSAEIIARFDNGKNALALKGKTFYCASGNIPYQVWQYAEKKAGIHIYNEHGDGIYVCSQFVACQTVRTEECEIIMPFDCIVEELFEGGIHETQNKVLKYHAKKGVTKLFNIKKKLL
jgi:hypothetical protein